MRIILTTLLLALCLSACVPAEPSSSAPESEPEVTSGLEVQFDDPAEPPAITATLDSTAIPWEMRPEHWNGSIQCGTDLATGLIKTRYAQVPPPSRAVPSPSPSQKGPGRNRSSPWPKPGTPWVCRWAKAVRCSPWRPA